MIMPAVNGSLRIDLKLIADMVDVGSRVLDVGCGDGQLLQWLVTHKNVDGRGIELSMAGVSTAVGQGLSVIQGDADADLGDYPAQAFDTVILSQTLQATHRPRLVLENMLRIGRRAIVSIPNFGHWRVRMALALNGRMPVNETLSYEWYDTPNIHFCTLKDFLILCDEMNVEVEHSLALDRDGNVLKLSGQGPLANMFAAQAVFVLRAKG